MEKTSLNELREIAKEKGISNISKLRKDELIEYVQKCFKDRSDYDTFINEIVYQIYGFNNLEINHIEHLI